MKKHPKQKHFHPPDLKHINDDILILRAYIRIEVDQMSDLQKKIADNRELLREKLREKKALMRRGK